MALAAAIGTQLKSDLLRTVSDCCVETVNIFLVTLIYLKPQCMTIGARSSALKPGQRPNIAL